MVRPDNQYQVTEPIVTEPIVTGPIVTGPIVTVNAQPRIPELSLVVATEHDGDLLEQSLTEIVDVLPQISERWEVVLVDDCSRDRSHELLARWCRDQPAIRVLTQRPRQGYAKAVARGFSASRYLTIALVSIGLPVDLHEIPRLFRSLHEADMVAAYDQRRCSAASSRLTSAVYHRLIRLLLEVRVQDVCCGLKLFRRSFFEMGRLYSDGFLIDAELFARAAGKGLRWTEVEVTVRPGRPQRPLLTPRRLPAAVAELRRLQRVV